ncbi:MAG: FtsQ-type POTRA domain-containing protein [Clostridia bacterium]|nr:FtsQ-type POTRA domain-containing protein [Clostridia bacterium]MBQ3553596.1 FtsQ-type POTRA domain-containing protein [Clostridia bacterium]
MAKTQKKKRYKFNKIRGIAVLCLLLATGLLCFCLFSPIFNITNISMHGNAMVSTEEIYERVAYLEGTNIFKINQGKIADTLRPLAYLDTIEIKRNLPSALEIHVTECSAELVFPYMTGYLLTDGKAKVLEEISDHSGWGLPVVYGADITEEKISEKITVQDDVKFDIILNCIDYLKKKEHLPQIRSMDFSDITNIWVTYQDGYRVNFAKFEDMERKMQMLDIVLPQVDRSEGTYIDLTNPSKVFTGKEEPKPEPEIQPEEEPSGEQGEEKENAETTEENTEVEEEENAQE